MAVFGTYRRKIHYMQPPPTKGIVGHGEENSEPSVVHYQGVKSVAPLLISAFDNFRSLTMRVQYLITLLDHTQ